MIRLRTRAVATALLACAALSWGCQNAAEALKDDSPAGGETQQPAAQRSAEAPGDFQPAGNPVELSEALRVDKNLDASNIRVDVDSANKTVVLRGTVPKASNRVAAEVIAKRHAANYKVVNQLEVVLQ